MREQQTLSPAIHWGMFLALPLARESQHSVGEDKAAEGKIAKDMHQTLEGMRQGGDMRRGTSWSRWDMRRT